MRLRNLLVSSIIISNLLIASTMLEVTNDELRAAGYLNPQINVVNDQIIINDDALNYYLGYGKVLDTIPAEKPVEIPWYVWTAIGFVGGVAIAR